MSSLKFEEILAFFDLQFNVATTILKLLKKKKICCFYYLILCKFEFWLGTITKNFPIHSLYSFFLIFVFLNYP